jgi:imidazolonepropionase-like amidohydrolase
MPEYLPRDPKWKDPAHIQFEEEPSAQFVLFTNARVYDGKSDVLSEPQEVLIHKNLIRKVGKLVPVPQDVKLIKVDCGGKTLMPGLIDMHSHICIQDGMKEGRDSYDQMAMGAMCAHDLLDYLQQGFTTCRDAGGNVLGIAKAVQKGRIPGPRIYPSGAFITQTGGPGDTGCCFDQPGEMDYLEKNGFAHVCNGRAEVLKACRNNIRNGATQLKIMASGSVLGPYNNFYATHFTSDEMKTAVEVANDYGTYVMAVSGVVRRGDKELCLVQVLLTWFETSFSTFLACLS